MFFVQSMFSPWVTPWFSVSYPNFYKLLFYWKWSLFFHIFFIIGLRQCRRKDTFFLKVKLYFRYAFFFLKNFVTMFDLALLHELQIRPWKFAFSVFLVLSFHNTRLESFSSNFSPWPTILLFCFDILGQNNQFTWKNLIFAFSLNFKNYPYARNHIEANALPDMWNKFQEKKQFLHA